MRTVRATILGLGVTIAFVVMFQTIGQQIWPFMTDVNFNDQSAVRAALASAPRAAVLFVVASYAVAGLVGAFLARKMAGGISTVPSWIVGGGLLLACAWNNLTIPQPLWMSVASLVVPLPSAWLGMHLAGTRVMTTA